MENGIRDHIRSNVVAYVALFFALGGGAAWATHPGGANTIDSTDIIDNQVKSPDIRDGNVTRDDIRTGAVVTEHVANDTTSGALTTDDVALNTLTGRDIDEGSLDKVPLADTLDNKDSSDFMLGQAAGGSTEASESTTTNMISASATGNALSVGYICPSDANSQGSVRVEFLGASPKVFLDNGSAGAAFFVAPASPATVDFFAAADGDHLTIQALYPDGTVATVEAFSVHLPNNPGSRDSCYAQAQVVVTRGP